MFPTNPSRPQRLIPSKSALRILYRLAFFSSAAVGAAAASGACYCLHRERARRIRILQRAVDNGRAIRAASAASRARGRRTVHSDSALSLEDAGRRRGVIHGIGPLDDQGGGLGGEGQVRGSVESGLLTCDVWPVEKLRRKMRRPREDWEDVLDDTGEISVRLIANDQNDGASCAGEGADADLHRTREPSAKRKQSRMTWLQPFTYEGARVVGDTDSRWSGRSLRHESAKGTMRTEAPKFRRVETKHKGRYPVQSLSQQAHSVCMQSLPSAKETGQMSVSDNARSKLFRSRSQSEFIAARSEASSLDKPTESSGRIMAKARKDSDHAVRSSFDRVKNDLHVNKDDRQRLRAARLELVRLSIKLGSLEHLTRVYFSTLAKYGSDLDLFILVVQAADTLGSKMDHNPLFQFYKDIFRHRHWTSREHVDCALQVLACAASWDLDIKPSDLTSTLLGVHMELISQKSVQSALGDRCRQLIASSDLSCAVDTFLVVVNCTQCRTPVVESFSAPSSLQNPNSFASIFKELIDVAIQTNDIAILTKLLLKLECFGEIIFQSGILQSSLTRFLQRCHQSKAHDQIMQLYLEKFSAAKISVSFLPEADQAIIVVACSRDPSLRRTFETIYSGLKSKQSTDLVENEAMCQALFSNWKATRNFEFVEEQFGRFRQRAESDGNAEVIRQLDVTMIEICIDADQLDRAISLLTFYHESDQRRSDTIALSALTFAKCGRWHALDQLLDLASTWPSFKFDSDCVHILNGVVRRYAAAHDPPALWRFVSRLLDSGRLPSSNSLHNIVMQAFNAADRPDLFSGWLRLCEVSGWNYVLNDTNAATLMLHYYREKRPRADDVMKQCRILLANAPSFKIDPFLGVLEEAYAYNLREANDGRQRGVATYLRKALEGVSQARDHLPDHVSGSEDDLFDKDIIKDESTAEDRGTAEDRCNLEEQCDGEDYGNLEVQGAVEETATPKHLWTAEEQHVAQEYGLLNMPQDDFGVDHTKVSQQWHDEVLNDDLGFAVNSLPTPAPAAGMAFQPMWSGNSNSREHLSESGATMEKALPRLELWTADVLQRKMITAMSLRQHDEVVRLYNSWIQKTGGPPTEISVEVAVSSSLFQNNLDTTEALRILREAHKAGIPVHRALQPLIINRINQMTLVTPNDFADLLSLVGQYYSRISAAGHAVGGKVATHAAHALIRRNCEVRGLQLLKDIFLSRLAREKKVDLAVLTLILHGYAMIGSIQGIHWVMKMVFEHNCRIDRRFLARLGHARRLYHNRLRPNTKENADGSARPNVAPYNTSHLRVAPADEDLAAIINYRRESWLRRTEQLRAGRAAGMPLVLAIIRAVNPFPDMLMTTRAQVEKKLFGDSLNQQRRPATPDRYSDAPAVDSSASMYLPTPPLPEPSPRPPFVYFIVADPSKERPELPGLDRPSPAGSLESRSALSQSEHVVGQISWMDEYDEFLPPIRKVQARRPASAFEPFPDPPQAPDLLRSPTSSRRDSGHETHEIPN